ncbi:MAG: VacB/RNase II family 3'-5' exoribonuclease [Nannocystis sp.]|nr:VacB/RNase II family 3'-5' exoribonuclease [Nannocystis sp.]
MQVNPSGFAFALRSDGEGSVFIPPTRIGAALDGDEVEVRSWPAERGEEGEVVAIVRRRRTRITGMARRAGKQWLLEPDDPRILWPARIDMQGASGVDPSVVVVARIERYPEGARGDMTVTIERTLGAPDTLTTEQAKVLIEFGIDDTFPDDVLAEAATVPSEVRPEDRAGRVDLRALPFMSIDPEDARDFDDAVCVELLGEDPEGADMRLHVAVADVSHYVREGTAIDREATWRSFSVYLPHRAIPMLPEQLSSKICSLVPGEDRLAMVVSMRLDASGESHDVSVRAAVIHSHARLTYSAVAGEMAAPGKLAEAVAERIHTLRAAADRLRRRRLARGAVELTLPEIRVILDEDDPTRIREIKPTRSSPEIGRAYNLVEELMLAANEATAAIAVRRRAPIVFRAHAPPDEQRLETFAAAAQVLGLDVDPEPLRTPRGVQAMLRKLEGHPKAYPLNMLMLRAMSQADYRTENIGHFALASDAYVHFTSPIRRYPDVIAHRVLKALLAREGLPAGGDPVPTMPAIENTQEQAVRASQREREVMSAERETKSLFATAFMRERIGDRLEGTISGVAQSGVFVALEDPYVDAMIRVASLEQGQGDSFEVEANGVRMVGRRSGFALCVGDRVTVEVVDANIQRRRTEVTLVRRAKKSG